MGVLASCILATADSGGGVRPWYDLPPGWPVLAFFVGVTLWAAARFIALAIRAVRYRNLTRWELIELSVLGLVLGMPLAMVLWNIVSIAMM